MFTPENLTICCEIQDGVCVPKGNHSVNTVAPRWRQGQIMSVKSRDELSSLLGLASFWFHTSALVMAYGCLSYTLWFIAYILQFEHLDFSPNWCFIYILVHIILVLSFLSIPFPLGHKMKEMHILYEKAFLSFITTFLIIVDIVFSGKENIRLPACILWYENSSIALVW